MLRSPMRPKLIEQDFLIDAQGVVYPLMLSSGNRDVLSDEGSGTPPIEYITERGPFQHGESVVDYFLRPRIVQYLIRQNFCSRQDAWNGRAALLDAVRPNKPGGPMLTLRKLLPDGSKRDLSVTIVDGPRFEPRKLNAWDEWSIQEVLRLIAYNPVYYNPTPHELTMQGCLPGAGFPYTFPFFFSIPCELMFPITFPISFYGWDVTEDIVYAGSWQEYPTIEIVGPAGPWIEIQNTTTGEVIKVSGYTIAPGDTMTIAIAYGSQSVTNLAGDSLLQYVTADSDLASFHLQPGTNTMRVILRSGGNATVTIRYYDRFIGI